MWLLLTSLALAQETQGPDTGPENEPSPTKTTAELLTDLREDEAADRLFAAKALRTQLKRALHVEAHGKPGSFVAEDARSLLIELEERLPAACTDALRFPNVVKPCADILAWLEATDSLPALEAAFAVETRKPVLRSLEQALTRLRPATP